MDTDCVAWRIRMDGNDDRVIGRRRRVHNRNVDIDKMSNDLIPVDERPPFYDKSEIEKYINTPMNIKLHEKGRPSYQPTSMYTLALNVLIGHRERHGPSPLTPHMFFDQLARMQILFRDLGCDVKYENHENLVRYLETKRWIRVCRGYPGDSIVFDPKK